MQQQTYNMQKTCRKFNKIHEHATHNAEHMQNNAKQKKTNIPVNYTQNTKKKWRGNEKFCKVSLEAKGNKIG